MPIWEAERVGVKWRQSQRNKMITTSNATDHRFQECTFTQLTRTNQRQNNKKRTSCLLSVVCCPNSSILTVNRSHVAPLLSWFPIISSYLTWHLTVGSKNCVAIPYFAGEGAKEVEKWAFFSLCFWWSGVCGETRGGNTNYVCKCVCAYVFFDLWGGEC